MSALLGHASLLILGCGLGGGEDAHAGGVEEESFDFELGALGGDFLAVPDETDSGGVADAGNDLARGMERSVNGRDEGFLADGLPVGGN